MFRYVLIGITFAFAAVAQPGQFQAYVLAQALAHGWRKTLPVALAPVLSDVPIICLVLFALTTVPPAFIAGLQIAGGLFLLYLAWNTARSWRGAIFVAVAEPSSKRQTVLSAALVNLLNPNPWIAWALILGPLTIRAWRETPANAITLVVTFYAMIVTATAAMVVFFSAARKGGERLTRALVGFSAIALAGFGIYQLYSGLSRFL